MEELIPILRRTVGEHVNAVDARLLHERLESRADFSTWMRERIAQLHLEKGNDYEVFHQPGENPRGGRPRIDYVLTLDAAKHVAMAERTDAGRRVRAYFISVERRMQERRASIDFSDPRVVVGVLQAQIARVAQLEAEVAEARPKVETYERIIATDDTFGVREAHKIVRDATGVTEREMISAMIQRGWAQRLGRRLAPAYAGEQRGFVTSRMVDYTAPDGSVHARPEMRLTARGVARLTQVLRLRDAS